MPSPRTAALLLGLLLAALPARAAELVLSLAGQEQRLDTASLLARPDVAQITIPADVSYQAARRYRAVPLRALLGAMEGVETVEAQASDGFASQLPAGLLRAGPAEPWIAVEDPAAPWPALPGKAASAGPFYLVWLNPAAGDVRPEQWPYMLARLTAVEPPLRRWPQLAVAAGLPATDPARHGAEIYVTQCLTCHRMKGAGAGEMGPDLGAPMPALAYLTEAGLRALIRDPAAVRTWPGRQMPAFDEAALPPAELEALVAYLRHQAGR
ncbi:cytochrome c [Roseomonas sp. USHLN139]|uniref:cytochrome c n=1 Tax=Roseomonas sp. USHLN139 TaxID=3081298 RepID=UPI003B019746